MAESGSSSLQRARSGLEIRRVFTTAGVHPYDTVTWGYSDIVQRSWRDDSISFEQRGVEFPDEWSPTACQIVASKYFRGVAGERESSLRQLIDRVVDTYVSAGVQYGYFAREADAEIFSHELKYMLVHQMFSFNSPVWFNIGTSSPQQVSACFLLSVNDSMESILNWYREEGLIFKGGSGAGVNLSRIRGSSELLRSSGGTASGPVSFMRGADASAGAIKSGGATRRAAKLVCLDVDHPDIEEFVTLKAREEEKIRTLAAAGFDMDLGGKDAYSVQYQNANNSVRVSDDFMCAVDRGDRFDLRARLSGETVTTVDARELFTKMARAAWECADPGIAYDDTINSWHTCPESGRINTMNPCVEFMHLDNSSCNLASLNLLKFLRDDLSFDARKFVSAVELVFTAMDISICFADFPTPEITRVTRAFRHLGIGHTNLGALLMATGHAYDSEGGRALAAAVTSLMQGTAYRRSAELAAVVGAYAEYGRNATSHLAVVARHRRAQQELFSAPACDPAAQRSVYTTVCAAEAQWLLAESLGTVNGYRNAHLSVIAPTGTISFMMGCDTTGVEPDFALVKTKKMADGSTLQIVNQTVARGLTALGYVNEQIEAIVAYVADHGHVVGAPGLRPEHYEVFDCAVGERSISPDGHLQMMAAVQPFISGAISKTINMPEAATVEDVEDVYRQGWRLGLKALAVYRDGCKSAQPLSVKKAAVNEAVAAAEVAPSPHEVVPIRHRLPACRPSLTRSFTVGSSQGYLTSSRYPDDGIGEIFLKLGKQGSTLAGLVDAFAIAVSIALQYGVPLGAFVEKFTGMQFEPRGMTDDAEIRLASSVLDYVFRRLALDYLDAPTRRGLGVLSSAERGMESEVAGPASTTLGEALPTTHTGGDAPLCSVCGAGMVRAGVCYACEHCGATSGCS